jgi:hypothetical protein
MNTQQAIATLDQPQPLALRSDNPNDLLKFAIERGADVGSIERLVALRDKFVAEQAQAEFNNALAAFQAECPNILRSRAGHENRYNYAPLEAIVEQVRPIMAKHGFSHSEDANVSEGWVEAVVTLTHRAGHSIQKRFKVPTQTNAGMSPQQKYGAAMTYATRYAFCAALGIRTADKDTDCPGGEENVTALQKKLWDLLSPVRGEQKNWAQAKAWLDRNRITEPGRKIAELSADQLRDAISKAEIVLQEGA